MKNFKEIQETVTTLWLREKMKEHGLRNQDFKELTGVTPQAISEILNNTPGRPQLQSRIVLFYFFELVNKEELYFIFEPIGKDEFRQCDAPIIRGYPPEEYCANCNKNLK